MKYTAPFSRLASLLLAVSAAACSSTPEYQAYVSAHQAQAQAQAAIAASQTDAEVARYNALSQIASSSTDPTSRVAAVMALAMDGRSSGNGNRQTAQQPIVAPVSAGETALRWAQVVAPVVTTVYGIRANSLTAMNASDNAARTSISTNESFVGIAARIQAPAANVTTTSTLSGTGVLGTGTYTSTPTTTTSTLGGSGVLGSGSYATTDRNDTTTTTSTDRNDTTTNPTTITPAGKVCSISSTGVVTCQ